MIDRTPLPSSPCRYPANAAHDVCICPLDEDWLVLVWQYFKSCREETASVPVTFSGLCKVLLLYSACSANVNQGVCVLCRELMPKSAEGQLTMEKTPSYYVTKEVPTRIYTMSKDTKLIVVVRNPVTRAISDYTQTRSKKPDIPSFESLTFKNISAGLIDTAWSAVQIGMYAKHLERWLQHFPMEQLLFVSGERLISDPAGEMARVQDFLGLRRVVTEKHFHFNPAKGFPCLKRPEGNSKPHCLGKTKGRTHPNIDPEVVQRLRDFYKPFNSRFYQLTGHDFGWDWDKICDAGLLLVTCWMMSSFWRYCYTLYVQYLVDV